MKGIKIEVYKNTHTPTKKYFVETVTLLEQSYKNKDNQNNSPFFCI